MELQICSIRDSKAEAHLNPMFFQSTPQAVRSFSDAVNDPQTDFSKHPEDYMLFHLGSFDPRTGRIELLTQPLALISGENLTEQG